MVHVNGKYPSIVQGKRHLGSPTVTDTLNKTQNLTLSSPAAGVAGPPLLMEGGTISGGKV